MSRSDQRGGQQRGGRGTGFSRSGRPSSEREAARPPEVPPPREGTGGRRSGPGGRSEARQPAYFAALTTAATFARNSGAVQGFWMNPDSPLPARWFVASCSL